MPTFVQEVKVERTVEILLTDNKILTKKAEQWVMVLTQTNSSEIFPFNFLTIANSLTSEIWMLRPVTVSYKYLQVKQEFLSSHKN